jgi:hypothetical protein
MRWHRDSTAPDSDVEKRHFRVTHPYHPLFQQTFALIIYRQNWGEDRVWFEDGEGRLYSLPANWTDAAGPDPFVTMAAGRSLFRVADLLELAERIGAWESAQARSTVKEKMS